MAAVFGFLRCYSGTRLFQQLVRMKKRASSVGNRPSTPHWALVPLLAGVLMGMAFSTAVLVRPYAETITTNIYLQLPALDEPVQGTAERLRELKRMLATLQATRHSGAEKLAEEVVVKAPVFYAVVMNNRHSSQQLQVLRTTWAAELPKESVGFFIAAEDTLEKEKEELEDVHYGEITLSESSPSLVELPKSHADFYLDVVSFICKHKVNESKWFFISGDNVYVKPKALETFVQQYENTPSVGYLGRPAPVGSSGVCMAGPGAMLSFSLLSSLCGRLEACGEGGGEREEVVGQCLVKELGQRCNNDVQGEEHFLLVKSAQLGSLTDESNHHQLEAALTIFPVTNRKEMYNLHQVVVGRELNKTRHEMWELKWALDRMTELLPHSNPKLQTGYQEQAEVVSVDDIVPWELVNHGTLLSSQENAPTREVPGSWRAELDVVVEKAVQYLSARSDSEHKFRRILSAYWRVEPTVGIHYIIDFETNTLGGSNQAQVVKRHRGTFTRPLNAPEVSPSHGPSPQIHVTIAVCLTSEYINQLQEFMRRLEAVLKHDQMINLVVIHMRSSEEIQQPRRTTNIINPKSILSLYKTKYQSASFTVVDSPALLSRLTAIAILLRQSRPSELLFIADLNLDFDVSFLERCRTIPIQGQQVYFPIVFSLANPSTLASFNHSLLEGTISQHSGHWLVGSYSAACVYAADLLSVSTQSTGKGIPQLVDLMEAYVRLLQKGYEIIRAPDKRLRRVFAERKCDLDFVGQPHEPCAMKGDAYELDYLKTQLSVLLFDHEGENSELKY